MISEHYPQFPADLVTFTEEILNGTRHFLCSVNLLYMCICVYVYSVYVFLSVVEFVIVLSDFSQKLIPTTI